MQVSRHTALDLECISLFTNRFPVALAFNLSEQAPTAARTMQPNYCCHCGIADIKFTPSTHHATQCIRKSIIVENFTSIKYWAGIVKMSPSRAMRASLASRANFINRKIRTTRAARRNFNARRLELPIVHVTGVAVLETKSSRNHDSKSARRAKGSLVPSFSVFIRRTPTNSWHLTSPHDNLLIINAHVRSFVGEPQEELKD